MQASDFYDLAQNLAHKLEDEQRSLAQYLCGTHRVEELASIMVQISVAYDVLEKHGKVMDKEREKSVKAGLYRLESLLIEVEEFQKGGAHAQPKSDIESFINTVASEAEHILEELKPFAGEGGDLVTEVKVKIGKEYNKLKDELIARVLDPKSGPVIPIFGKPGIGKSTLARAVFSACRFENGFDIAEWVSLSRACTRIDLVREVLKSVVRRPDLPFSIDDLLVQFEKCIRGKKFLVVLDDLLDEDFLWSLLSKHKKDPFYSAMVQAANQGSKILLTSRLTPQGSFLTLTGEDESWELFQSIAFKGLGKDQDRDIVSILSGFGLQICQKFDNIPAAIKIVASILSSKPTVEEWKYFHDMMMTSERNPLNSILFTVELISEVHKRSRKRTNQRHCYAFCSLLPKDYKFKKDDLLHLWMAQGFHISEYRVKRELESYFNEFLSRGFFLEERVRDGTNLTVSYKISNLGHELMKHIGGDDFALVDRPTVEVDCRIIRHVSFIVDSSWQAPSWLTVAKQLQSLLLWPSRSGEFITIPHIDLSQMKSLCILHLEAVHCESLQRSLDKLRRLRYLRLGAVSCISFFEYIPVAETLPLFDSRNIGAIKLLFNGGVRLIDGNHGTPEFSLSIKPTGSENLTINYEKCYELELLQKTHRILEALNDISLESRYNLGNYDKLELLKPHAFFESRALCWKGEMFPAQLINEFTVLLHYVSSVQIVNCDRCQYLPTFSALPNLRLLQLWGLKSLECIEICDENNGSSSTAYFPSLKSLMLGNMPKLKQWSRKTGSHHLQIIHRTFPCLSEVKVQGCPKLISMPSAPRLESLEAINIDAKMLKKLLFLQVSSVLSTSSASSRVRKPAMDSTPELVSGEISFVAPGSLESEECQGLIDSSKQHVSFLKYLKIDGCKGFDWGDTLNAVEKSIVCLKAVWHGLYCLRTLKLINSSDLVSLPRGLECIETLEQLSLCSLSNVKVLPEGIGQLSRLQWLTIHYCLKLTTLPKSLGSFSALEQLEIRYCPRLKQFPESFPNLKVLHVKELSSLEELLRASQNLEELEIDSCEVEQGREEGNGYGSVGTWQGLKSLRSVKLSNISKLESLPRGLQCTPALEKLTLFRLFKLQNLPDWIGQFTQLHWLAIQYCSKLTLLPETLGSLSSLEHLEIEHCAQLKQLPVSLKNITSLKQLEIRKCLELETRCRKPNGEDWALVQHIPNIICGELSQLEEPDTASVS